MGQGEGLHRLQHMLGHALLSMTMRYAHLSQDHLYEAVKLNPLT